MSFSKDDTEILNDTVLRHIGKGLRLIADGSRFIVTAGMEVSFSCKHVTSDLIVDCSTNLYLVDDIKFYAHMSRRDGMSNYWCLWCQLHPSKWQTFHEKCSGLPEEKKKMWTVELHKETLQKIINGQLKEPKEKKGVVGEPIWDFIELATFIFPHLPFEIGVVNMVLEKLLRKK